MKYEEALALVPVKNGWIHEEGEDSDSVVHYVDGVVHREDGPAVIDYHESQFYYQNGKCHREDGPAIIWSNGSEDYIQNGKFHREDGPARIFSSGAKEYWVNGVRFTEKQFRRKYPIKES